MTDAIVYDVKVRGFKRIRREAKRAAKAIRQARREHKKYVRAQVAVAKALRKAGLT